MDILLRGRTKETTVKWSVTDKRAAELIVYNLAEYGKKMDDPDVDALSDRLNRACIEIGLIEVEDAPKEDESV